MNKNNYIKKTALPVVLLFSFALLSSFGSQGQARAAVNVVQQQGIIKGMVVDAKGEPIIGANVVATGTTNGTITDIDGVFKINVKPGTKLKISFIGYSEQTVVAKNDMRVVLVEDATALQEVEIVAYGVQKKVTMTGAVASVKADDILRTPVGSVSNVLGGQMTGLTTVQYSGEPGADAADIFVRGKATWADSSPLVQVDGVERSMTDIDPNEIESITVLKDASATAVFGIRGANGVILITTKRGKEGRAKVSFTTSASVLMPTKMVEQASSYEYANFYNQMLANDGKSDLFSADVIQKFADHSDPIRFPDMQWADYIMKSATLQSQHNMSISGGTDKVRYFISAGAYTQGGLFNEFDLPYNLSYQYRRFNYRTNLDMDVTKTTTLSFNISGNIDNSDKPNNSNGTSAVIKNIYYATPFYSPGIVDGKMIYTGTDYTDLKLPFTGDTDPMTYRNGKFKNASNNKLNIDLILDQKLDFLTKGLSFKLKGSYNSSFSVTKTGVCGIATYTPVLMSDGTIEYKKSGENTSVSYNTPDRGKGRDWYMEASLNYARSFGNHNISALMLYNQSKEYYYGSSSSQYRDVPRGYVGLVGRVTYDWKNRYLAEVNVGYNGSENFAPEKRFGTFPAGSIGWVMSEEKWFQPLKPFVSFLKLRASFGLVGNDKTKDKDLRFLYLPDPYLTGLDGEPNCDKNNWAYPFGVDNSTISLGAMESAKNNANVGWEKSFKQNYGMDINFFDDRLSATAEYYREHRTDILVQDGTAPGLLGFSVPYANLGEVNSWGWELSLKWNDKIGKNFRYWANVNLSYNQNEIIEDKAAPQNEAYQYTKGHRIGARSQYVFWRYYDEQTAALYEQTFNRPYPAQLQVLQNGDAVYLDLNGDRKIDANDMSYDYGFTDDPEYMVGINFGFSWKNWEVSTQWTGAWNVSRMISDVFRRPFLSSAGNQYGGLLSYHLTNTWTKDNPSQDAKYPRATWDNAENNYAESTLYEQDSKYLRLKTLQVAYNFQVPLMKKLGLNTMQLAFSGYNLLTFTPYIWGDPETRASNSPSYPLSKTYTLSLKLGF